MLLIKLNYKTGLQPISNPAPPGEINKLSTSSGSDHIILQNGPSFGISPNLLISRIESNVGVSGFIQPWIQKNF